MFTFGAANDK